MPTTGIYRITNLQTEYVYIGQSKNCEHRISNHKCGLRKNNHYNKHLQHSYNKYGGDNFIFEIIEECEDWQLCDREQYWIDYYPKSYNVRPADMRDPLSEEHKKAIGKSSRKVQQRLKEEGYYQIAVYDLKDPNVPIEYYPCTESCPYNFNNKNYNFKLAKCKIITRNRSKEQIFSIYQKIKNRYDKYILSITPTINPKTITQTYYIAEGYRKRIIFDNKEQFASYFNINLSSVSYMVGRKYVCKTYYTLMDKNNNVVHTGTSPKDFIGFNGMTQSGINKLYAKQRNWHKNLRIQTHKQKFTISTTQQTIII